MASDDESKDKASKLTCREEYPGWKSRVQMLALAKGDVNGIFGDDGSDATVGYQAISGGVAARSEAQKEWKENWPWSMQLLPLPSWPLHL